MPRLYKGMARARAGRPAMRRRFGRRRPLIRRPRVTRPVRSSSRTFTEVLDGGSLSSNAGGTFKVNFNSIPQAASYAKLYRQFCIRKLQVMLLPLYTDAEMNTALGTLDYQATRVAFSISDTPMLTVPASELDVLTQNGARVVIGHKKILITCWPKPDLTEVVPGIITNTYAAVRQRKSVWLNTDTAGQAYDGQDVLHGGISYWVSNNLANMGVPVFKVYFKVTFAMRDPA